MAKPIGSGNYPCCVVERQEGRNIISGEELQIQPGERRQKKVRCGSGRCEEADSLLQVPEGGSLGSKLSKQIDVQGR